MPTIQIWEQFKATGGTVASLAPLFPGLRADTQLPIASRLAIDRAVRWRRGRWPHEGRIHPDKERRDVCATRGWKPALRPNL